MDDIARYNKDRWEDLARNNVEFSRPYLDLTPETALTVVDPYNMLGDIAGKDILALASGGGQQSVAFTLLGAHTTVFDLSETQLEKDRTALAHYKLTARLEQGDMRDLSRFANNSFDLVYHAFSINFIPDASPVFDEIVRVLRPGGLYRLNWHNPFYAAIDESQWNGTGYTVGQQPYADGELTWHDGQWEIYDEDGTVRRVKGPRDFNHTLSTVINGLIGRGFTLLGIQEEPSGDPSAPAGSWEHLIAHTPPWLQLWARLSK